MNRKTLINQLQLSYSPMSNYEFNILRKEKVIQDILKKSSLYVLVQRAELTFDHITFSEEEKFIEFEIHQKNNPEVLICKLPFFQENIATDPEKIISINFGRHNAIKPVEKQELCNIHGMQFYEGSEDSENFLLWISPEKFIYDWMKGAIEAEVTGDYKKFLKYSVLYVGKATEQHIWDRLTGHSTLQEILSIEKPLTYGSLPTHEIAILFFDFYDNLLIKTFDHQSNLDDMTDSLFNDTRPDQKPIFLDVEKALVKTMQPVYNKILFKNYPNSKDGLASENYNSFSYTLMDPITLVYSEGEIEGGNNPMGGDVIVVKDNQNMDLIKHRTIN